ncbi:DUF503 domain-containing protein [Megalodesulfovibrio paquesii]
MPLPATSRSGSTAGRDWHCKIDEARGCAAGIMVIGTLLLEFTLHGNDSLKGKRNVAQSLKRKLRNKFNVAVAEVDSLESHTRLVLACVTVSNEAAHAQGLLTKVQNMVEAATDEELTDSQMEILRCDD